MINQNADHSAMPDESGGAVKNADNVAQTDNPQENTSLTAQQPQQDSSVSEENPQQDDSQATGSESHTPHQQTPMMLINEISKLFRDRIRDQNMQNSYRMLLFHLAIRGGRTQLELANMTHLKPPTISVTLQKMEADGYVRRVPNERDMRQTLVYLTEKGEEYNRNIRKKIDIIDRNIESGFTEEELQTLMSLLSRIRDNIRHQERFDSPAE